MQCTHTHTHTQRAKSATQGNKGTQREVTAMGNREKAEGEKGGESSTQTNIRKDTDTDTDTDTHTQTQTQTHTHTHTHTHTESGKNGLANRLKKSIKHRKLSNAGGIVEAGTRENVKHRRVNAAVQILEPA